MHVRSWQVAYRGMLPDAVLDGLSVEQRTVRWADRLGHGDDLPGRQLLVARRGHAIEGFATFGPCRDADGDGLGELYAIYVDPDAWGQGIGRRLIQRAVEGLRAAGFAGATLWVLEANVQARGFYEHAGWRTDGAQRTEEFGEDRFAATVVRYRRGL